MEYGDPGWRQLAALEQVRSLVRGCEVCGAPTGDPLVKWVRGKRVVIGWVMQTAYCSNACKQKAYRQRQKALRVSSAL